MIHVIFLMSESSPVKPPEAHKPLAGIPSRTRKDKSKPDEGTKPVSTLSAMLDGIATTAAPSGITSPRTEVETFTPPRDESVHDRALKKMMGKDSQVKEATMMKPTGSPRSLDTGTNDVKAKEATTGKIDQSIDRKGKEREK